RRSLNRGGRLHHDFVGRRAALIGIKNIGPAFAVSAAAVGAGHQVAAFGVGFGAPIAILIRARAFLDHGRAAAILVIGALFAGGVKIHGAAGVAGHRYLVFDKRHFVVGDRLDENLRRLTRAVTH